MKKIIIISIIILVVLLLITLLIFSLIRDNFKDNMELLPQEIEGYIPPNGFVPDEETARKIAETVWLPIYGRQVLRQKPYRVKLIDEKIWIVEGTLKGIPFVVGGTAYIEINKNTGEIIKVTHSK